MKLFLQKTAKFSSAVGSAPGPPEQPPLLRISGYAPGTQGLKNMFVSAKTGRMASLVIPVTTSNICNISIDVYRFCSHVFLLQSR